MTAPLDTPQRRPERPLSAVPDLPAAASAAEFSETVRAVAALARSGRLEVPVFRSPPRRSGVDRTIRRRPGGPSVVAVRRDGRPLAAIQSDVIEGVVAANWLDGERADRFRHAAWARLDDDRRTGGSGRAAQRASGERPPARVA